MPPRYDLVEQPCVPIVRHNGSESAVVSLRTALTEAVNFVGLAPDNALAAVVLVRLLSAIVLASDPSIRGREDIERLWSMGSFDIEALERYFADRPDSFELFGQDRPFYQVAGLKPLSGEPKPASALRLSVATGNNVPLFSTLTEADAVRLSPAEAFLGLLAVQGYDTAAIKTGVVGDPAAKAGKTTGNPTGNLGQLGAVLPLGQNLFHTLLLNLPLVSRKEDDLPAWDRVLTPAWEIRQPRGTLDLLTWQSRRVRLIPDDDGYVVGAVIGAGDRMHFTPPELEPHTCWRDTKTGDVARRPVRWSPGQAAWRGLDSLLALEHAGDVDTAMVIRQLEDVTDWLDESYPLSVLCVGVQYGNQSAVIEDVFIDRIPMPVAALRARDPSIRTALTEVVLSAEKVRQALNGLSDNIRQAQGGERLPWDKGSHPGTHAMMQFTAPTTELLIDLQCAPGRLADRVVAWERAASVISWTVADGLLDQASPGAFRGHEITVGGKERTIRLADAEAWFRAALAKALPRISAEQRPQRRTS
ncbi:MAG: type I-E CRISPR-associated protein Cse1/CasA [Actinomycetales bacterium]|nr:type I-E CRISPR-associated protein Cse1/CasA [Actinomycetales bacterium]